MEEYYRRRAEEFEAVYDRADPARRAEIKLLSQAAQEALRGRRVLEVACGTGYWTRLVSRTAREITATDSGGRGAQRRAAQDLSLPGDFSA